MSINTMNDKQRETLKNLCDRYKVTFNEDDYLVYPTDSFMMAGYAEGWVGGNDCNGTKLSWKTIFVGVSPEGEAHS